MLFIDHRRNWPRSSALFYPLAGALGILIGCTAQRPHATAAGPAPQSVAPATLAAFLLVYPRERLVVAMAANSFSNWGEVEARRLAGFFLP